MSRGQFLRTAALAGGAVAIAGMGLGGTVSAAFPFEGTGNPDPDNIISDGKGGWIIYPTGEGADIGQNPCAVTEYRKIISRMTRDSRNIQWALVNADTSVVPQPQITLKAMTKPDALGQSVPMYFNFQLFSGSNPVNVKILKSVMIVGEMLPEQYTGTFPGGERPDVIPDRTMIYGGKSVIYSNITEPAPIEAPNMGIRNVYFAYPCKAVFFTKICSGFEVSDCVIYDVSSGEEDFTILGGIPFRLAIPIEATGLNLIFPPNVLPNNYLNGNCTIVNNVVKRRKEENNIYYGLQDIGILLQSVNMNANISGNEVYNFPYAGIGQDSNTGSTTITNNRVFNCAFGGAIHPIYYPVFFPAGAGIGIRGRMNTPSTLLIESNLVECGFDQTGHRISQTGISLGGVTGAVVRGNTVTGTLSDFGPLNSPPTGLLIGNFSYTYMENGVTKTITLNSTNNLVSGNDLAGLTAGLAQMLIDVNCDNNQAINNAYGPLKLGYNTWVKPTDPNYRDLYGKLLTLGALVINGNGNLTHDDDFRRCNDLNTVFGWNVPLTNPYGRPAEHLGCVSLGAGTSGNIVEGGNAGSGEATWLGPQNLPPGTDFCNQVLNTGLDTNKVYLQRACTGSQAADVLEEVKLRNALNQLMQSQQELG